MSFVQEGQGEDKSVSSASMANAALFRRPTSLSLNSPSSSSSSSVLTEQRRQPQTQPQRQRQGQRLCERHISLPKPQQQHEGKEEGEGEGDQRSCSNKEQQQRQALRSSSSLSCPLKVQQAPPFMSWPDAHDASVDGSDHHIVECGRHGRISWGGAGSVRSSSRYPQSNNTKEMLPMWWIMGRMHHNDDAWLLSPLIRSTWKEPLQRRQQSQRPHHGGCTPSCCARARGGGAMRTLVVVVAGYVSLFLLLLSLFQSQQQQQQHQQHVMLIEQPSLFAFPTHSQSLTRTTTMVTTNVNMTGGLLETSWLWWWRRRDPSTTTPLVSWQSPLSTALQVHDHYHPSLVEEDPIWNQHQQSNNFTSILSRPSDRKLSQPLSIALSELGMPFTTSRLYWRGQPPQQPLLHRPQNRRRPTITLFFRNRANITITNDDDDDSKLDDNVDSIPARVTDDISNTSSYHHPASSSVNLPLEILRHWLEPDLGGLKLESLAFVTVDAHFSRRIASEHDRDRLDHERRALIDAMDDELESNRYDLRDERDFRNYTPNSCVQPGWTMDQYPTCNVVHELQVEGLPHHNFGTFPHDINYLGKGHYREAWMFRDRTTSFNRTQSQQVLFRDVVDNHENDNENSFVLKHFRFHNDIHKRSMWLIRTEALVMERLTPSSRIADIYGFCGMSLMVQYGQGDMMDHILPFRPRQPWNLRGRIHQHDLDQLESARPTKDPVLSMNKLSVEQKLYIATAMAESLAEMHGYVGGVMVNDDIYPTQWILTPKGDVRLNDMNNAKLLRWSHGKQQYCKHRIQFSGDFKAPEELVGAAIDETVDMWPMGNLIFSLLTGLKPYYDVYSDSAIQNITTLGIPPYLNPHYRRRSLIEQRLVELMEQCHQFHPQDRITIFDAVYHLHRTAVLYQRALDLQRKRVYNHIDSSDVSRLGHHFT